MMIMKRMKKKKNETNYYLISQKRTIYYFLTLSFFLLLKMINFLQDESIYNIIKKYRNLQSKTSQVKFLNFFCWD